MNIGRKIGLTLNRKDRVLSRRCGFVQPTEQALQSNHRRAVVVVVVVVTGNTCTNPHGFHRIQHLHSIKTVWDRTEQLAAASEERKGT